MCQNEIQEFLKLVELVHVGEIYPACGKEMNAIVDVLWDTVLKRSVNREIVWRKVAAFFNRRKNETNY